MYIMYALYKVWSWIYPSASFILRISLIGSFIINQTILQGSMHEILPFDPEIRKWEHRLLLHVVIIEPAPFLLSYIIPHQWVSKPQWKILLIAAIILFFSNPVWWGNKESSFVIIASWLCSILIEKIQSYNIAISCKWYIAKKSERSIWKVAYWNSRLLREAFLQNILEHRKNEEIRIGEKMGIMKNNMTIIDLNKIHIQSVNYTC